MSVSGETTVYKSYYPKAAEINPQWVVIDAAGLTLGRITSQIAALLLGKNKPTFTPASPWATTWS